MTIPQFFIIILYAVGLLAGQLLFKAAAKSSNIRFDIDSAFRLALNPYFICAMVLYLSLSVAWVGILTKVPLSRAYPVVAINFFFTALLGVFLFGERVSPINWFGIILICSGIIFATR